MDIELAQTLEENELLKSMLYCKKRSCKNCGKVNCENFQRQRIDCCGKWVSYKDYIKQLEAQIEKMKNCKNCPENKGGFICQKEYEDKCLAQKIQYIKELKEENAELKKQQFSLRNERNTFLAQNEQYEKDLIDFNDQLTKAKELLERLLITSCNSDVLNLLPNCSEVLRVRVEAEQFLNSEV